MKTITLNTSRENMSLLSKRRNDLLGRQTSAEKHIGALLSKMGERFIPQKGFFTNYRFFFVDFYLPKRKKLCLEIDGAYHEEQLEYDEMRDTFLKQKRGFRVVRITNEQAMMLGCDGLLSIITPKAGA